MWKVQGSPCFEAILATVSWQHQKHHGDALLWMVSSSPSQTWGEAYISLYSSKLGCLDELKLGDIFFEKHTQFHRNFLWCSPRFFNDVICTTPIYLCLSKVLHTTTLSSSDKHLKTVNGSTGRVITNINCLLLWVFCLEQ